jgi:D-alanyl-D-alanine-carboxypeptidase/D-alanyl-D-alanine-endopeptidase
MKIICAGVLCCVIPAVFAADSSFDSVVRERIAASATPACIAVALVGETTNEALACTEGISPVPFDRHSAFEIGSITKGFTGLLLADMVLKGEVSLDDPASKYSRPGAKLPTYEGRDITLRDLVTQTSGLPGFPPGFVPKNMRNPFADLDADALYAALARTEIKRPIGKTPEYSNFGFMWLSEMLARRGGKHLDVLMKERVLDPLGMNDTFFTPSDAQRARMVQPHAAPYEPTPVWDVPLDLAGVGMLRSSLADMEKLASALAGRRDTPLKDAIALALEPLRPAQGGGNFTGFGWVTTSRDGMLIHWHNGGTGGSRSVIAVNPRTKNSAIVLVNSAVSFDDLAMHLVEPKFPLTKKHVRAALDADARGQYVGRYDFGPPNVLEVFVVGDKMMTRMTGQQAIEIAPEGNDSFFTIGVDAALEFKRDAANAIDAVVLHQGGREIRAARLP